MGKKLKIAITGGYASGKSSVLKIFAENGFKTYSADGIYADLLNEDEFVLAVSKTVGVEPINENGKLALDRKAVSEVVFSNSSKLEALNSFTHKAIYDKINEYYNESKTNKIVFEIPLLFEDGMEKDFDEIIIVLRNAETRKAFGAVRDGISELDAEKRIKNQVNYDNISMFEHTLIHNNGDLQCLKQGVKKVIEELEKKLS